MPKLPSGEIARSAPSRTERPLLSAAVYAVAGAFQRALGLLLLPLYTRALTPSEYGDLSVILSVSTAAVILLAMGQDSALFRTYFRLEGDPAAQRNFVASTWSLLIGTSLIGVALLVAIAWPIVAGGRIAPSNMALGLASSAAMVISTTVPMALLRAEQRLKAFIALTACSAICTTTLTVTLVVVLDHGIGGWLIAALTANVITAVFAMVLVPYRRPRPFDGHGVREALRLGVPLMPHFLSHWALQLADRAVLTGLVSASAVGVYSLTSNLALPALIAVQSLNQGFMPTYARAANQPDPRGALRAMATTQLLVSAGLCLVCAVILPPLVTVVAPSSYTGAAHLVPWIVLGYGFLAAYYLPMNGLSLVVGRTTFVWVATVASAALNIALILLFAGDHGLEAAAIASAAGYLALLVGTGTYARWVGSPVGVEPVRAGTGLAAVVGLYVLIDMTTPAEGATGVLVRGGVLLGCGAAIALTWSAKTRAGTRATPEPVSERA